VEVVPSSANKLNQQSAQTDANLSTSPEIYGFKPIIPPQPQIIILGTMPSVESLSQSFYYAHPRNAFWSIISHFYGHELASQAEKVKACQDLGIFLWDVLASCQRQGSLDSAIKEPQANDFETLFNHFPELKVVAFNGQAAAKLFKQYVIKLQNLPSDLQFIQLPSTSPANARLKLEDKCLLWQEKLLPLL
jgi:TDG/mug DNA glycosylase family protein